MSEILSDTRSPLKKMVVASTPWVAFAFALFGVPMLSHWNALSIEAVNMLARFMCFAIVAVGIDLVWGYTGILSLCQAMFFCFGGYAMGMHLALHGPLDGDGIPRCLFVVTSDVSGFKLPGFWEPFKSLPMALLLVVFVPGISAFIFGYFAFRSRVRGVYFSIITQATTLGVCLLFRRNEMRLCGTNGLTNFETLAGYDLRSPDVKLGLYVITVLVLAAVYVGCNLLVNSRLGRVLIAIRDNESRLRFSGYKPLYFKVFVFTLAAVIAGIGGMLYAPQTGIITPFNMEPEKSVFMIVWVAFGGRGRLTGAIVGALLVNYGYAILTSGTIYNMLFTPMAIEKMGFVQRLAEMMLGPKGWPFVLGALFIGVVLFLPDGLVGLWHRILGSSNDANSSAPKGATQKLAAADPHIEPSKAKA